MDSWLSDLVSPTELYFTDLRFAHLQPGSLDKKNKLALLTVDFTLDENIAHYNRRVHTIADVFSNVGGLMGIVLAMVSFLLSPIQL
jgi:hypothetical protein